MSQIVVKKKHLRYVLYVSILLSISFIRRGINNPYESEEEILAMETNSPTDVLNNKIGQEVNFDNQYSSESFYNDVAINFNSGRASGLRFSKEVISNNTQTKANSTRSEAYTSRQESATPSVGMQIYEEVKEVPLSSGGRGPQSPFTKYKSFASVGGAFGGGASALEDGNGGDPPGGPTNPTQVPLDNEVYLVLIAGLMIGFLALKKKKLAI